MSDTVTLTVGGKRHDGWTEISVTRAIDTLTGEFELSLTERWSDTPELFTLEAGASCVVEVDGETLITGFIDRLAPSIDGETHGITISGRDRAGDLIDCSAIHKPGSWRDASIEQIASELAAPFGIKVTARAPTGARLRRFALQQGESVHAAIERLCRFAGVLAISTAAGDVELIVPASDPPVETFTEGRNILSGAASHDTTDRFSSYIVKGQSVGDDHANGRTVAAPSGTAGDPAVRRHRPLLVVAEEQTTLANARTRAAWEATTRAARAQNATIVVPGWRRPDGKLRDRNTTAMLEAPALFMSGRMLVQSVRLILDERGAVSELTLVPPEAWSQLAVPEKAEASRIGPPKRKPA